MTDTEQPGGPSGGTLRPIRPAPPAVAAFAGFAAGGPVDRPVRCESAMHFESAFGGPATKGARVEGSSLADAVRAHFRNGGGPCWVARAPGRPGEGTAAAHVRTPRGPSGLGLLAELEEPLVLSAPDAHAVAEGAAGADFVTRALVGFAEAEPDRCALLFPPAGASTTQALAWRDRLNIQSPAAAAYHPWVITEERGIRRLLPPCGHVTGTWSRLEREHGVAHAPTGADVSGLAGTAGTIGPTDQTALNRAGINVLRCWPDEERVRLWGGRTMSPDPDLRYLHHRRVVAHLAASILAGTRWVAEVAWDEEAEHDLVASVEAFLRQAWRDGLLRGAAAEQAFSVAAALSTEDETEHVVISLKLAVRGAGLLRGVRVVQAHDG